MFVGLIIGWALVAYLSALLLLSASAKLLRRSQSTPALLTPTPLELVVGGAIVWPLLWPLSLPVASLLFASFLVIRVHRVRTPGWIGGCGCFGGLRAAERDAHAGVLAAAVWFAEALMATVILTTPRVQVASLIGFLSYAPLVVYATLTSALIALIALARARRRAHARGLLMTIDIPQLPTLGIMGRE